MSIGTAIRDALRTFHEATGDVITGIRLDAKTYARLENETRTRLFPIDVAPAKTIIIDGYCEVWGEDEG